MRSVRIEYTKNEAVTGIPECSLEPHRTELLVPMVVLFIVVMVSILARLVQLLAQMTLDLLAWCLHRQSRNRTCRRRLATDLRAFELASNRAPAPERARVTRRAVPGRAS